MVKVFAVVVTYNGMKWFDKCFGSLASSSFPIATVVIDNGSTDGSREWLNRQENGKLKVILSEKNLGFGQANNLGISYALSQGADHIFLLNQDAWIEIDTIRNLLTFQQQHSEYGIISPIHLNGNGSKLDGGFMMYLTRSNPQFLSDLYLSNIKTVYDCRFINAAAWLLSRTCVEKVGGFDPIFFHYGEDENYCQRVLYHGMKIGVVPAERIYHDRDDRSNSDGLRKEQKQLQDWRYKIIQLTDINNSQYLTRWRTFEQQFLKDCVKSIFKLKFSRAGLNLKELRDLSRMKQEIEASRNRNKQHFAHLQQL